MFFFLCCCKNSEKEKKLSKKSLEGKNIIKDIRNLHRLKTKRIAIKDIRNTFGLKK